jgi:hypothetical protein
MNAISIEKQGRRYYLVGNTYPVKDSLRDAGAHWDRDRGAWWTSKSDVAEQFAARATEIAQQREAAATETQVAIEGNTYPVRDQLRAMGGRWDAARKVWMVPASRADEARALVPARTARRGAARQRGTWTGCSCGSVEEYEKPSDCASCQHDR